MFRDSADEDYLMARWAFRNGLSHPFFWNAQQATEKYLKGALLLNGCVVSQYGHELAPMFDLLPIVLCPPKYFRRESPLSESYFVPTKNFVSDLSDLGHPSNRYRHFSVTYNSANFHHFDEFTFLLRRLVFPLGLEYREGETYGGALRRMRRFMPHKLSVLDTSNKRNLRVRKAVLAWRNFSFYEETALKQGKRSSGISFTNSEISINLNRNSEGHDAIRWLLRSAKFTRPERTELNSLLAS
jgi:hypothetical protein